MPVKLAINGYGRIGRMVLRALYESGRRDDMQIVAVNDLGDAQTNAHLTRYDSAHGRFPFPVEVGDGELVVDGDSVKVFAERNPADLPWKELGVDIVLECTGLFRTKDKASAHLDRRREESRRLGPGRDQHRRNCRLWRQPPYPGRLPPRHFQRLLHHQLPGAGGQGAARGGGHRAGPDDHHPRLHQRPGPLRRVFTRTCGGRARRPSR